MPRDDRLMILKMVSEGQLAVDDAAQLLTTLARLDAQDGRPVEAVELEKEERIVEKTVGNDETIIASAKPELSIAEKPSFPQNIWLRIRQFVSLFDPREKPAVER